MTDNITLPRSVVEQALEALFIYKPMVTGVTFQHGLEAMQALRAALEQPVEQEPVSKSDNYLNGYCTGRTDLLREQQVEQEPVAWAETNANGEIVWNTDSCFSDDPDWLENPTALYTHPHPPRQPLTDQQIHDCFQHRHRDKATERRMITRAIEFAHGITGDQE